MAADQKKAQLPVSWQLCNGVSRTPTTGIICLGQNTSLLTDAKSSVPCPDLIMAMHDEQINGSKNNREMLPDFFDFFSLTYKPPRCQ